MYIVLSVIEELMETDDKDTILKVLAIHFVVSRCIVYIRDAQPAARRPDPAPKCVISGSRSRLKIQETSPKRRRFY